MSTGIRWCLLTLALFAGACDSNTAEPSTSELDAYCAVARRGDLASWVGDVLTLCQSDGSEEGVTCQAARPSAAGVDPIALGDRAALRVLPASGGRVVVLGTDSRVTLVGSDGNEQRELAAWATDPWISDDGQRAAWIGLPAGVDAFDFGVPTVVVAQDLQASSPTVIAEDELASTPRPIPGSSDVLYVSAQTGLASFWVAGPSRTPEQLTNIGLTEIGQETVPVADRELAWMDGALFYSVPGDEGARLFRLDIASADARELGPGEWPRTRSGSIIALAPAGESCAAVYTNGGAP
jgi:hypothetical protein